MSGTISSFNPTNPAPTQPVVLTVSAGDGVTISSVTISLLLPGMESPEVVYFFGVFSGNYLGLSSRWGSLSSYGFSILRQHGWTESPIIYVTATFSDGLVLSSGSDGSSSSIPGSGGGEEGGGGPVFSPLLIRTRTPKPAITYDPGETMVQGYGPGGSYQAMHPLSWTIPAKVGDVEGIVRLTFTEVGGKRSLVVDRTNTTGAPVTERMADVLALGVFDTADGFICSQVSFLANNVGLSQVATLDTFSLRGYQT